MAAVPGWESRIDPASGRRFYVNLVERTTTWDPPVPVAAPQSNTHLPSGWEARVDPQSGRTFYVNLHDKTTSWTRPTVGASSEQHGVTATSSAATDESPAAALAFPDMASGGRPADDVAVAVAEAERLASEASNGGGAQPALDSVDAMWARSQAREPSQPAADPAEGAAASMTSPPPAGASREEVRAYREALRATAVQNIRRTQAEVAEAMTRVTDEQSQGLDR